MNKTVRVALAALATLSVGATACADKDDTAKETEHPEAEAGNGLEADAEAALAEGGETGTMPDVVCLDLQSAQDTIQAETDLFWSDSRDVSGQDRMQVIDSNWVVLAQSPAPGTPLSEKDTPMLDVVKHGEPGDDC